MTKKDEIIYIVCEFMFPLLMTLTLIISFKTEYPHAPIFSFVLLAFAVICFGLAFFRLIIRLNYAFESEQVVKVKQEGELI